MAATVTVGVGLAALGCAIEAQGSVGFIPDYHWCPGQAWDPGWGANWDEGNCHDDFHRDIDGPDHSRDFGGPGRGGDLGGPGDRGPNGDGGIGGGDGGHGH